MSVSSRFTLLLTLPVLAACAFSACGGDDGGGGSEENGKTNGDEAASTDSDTLRLVFSPMYSAFIPGHDTKLPVIVDGKMGATITAADTSMVDIDPTADGAMLTIKKAGTTTIIAKVGNETGRAKLTVTAFTAEEWEAGNTRYNNGTGLGLADGGIPRPMAGATAPMVNPNTACASCHGEASEIGDVFGADIEHTPAQTGGYSDDELINIFTMAKKPTGVGQHTMIPAFLWQMFHKWSVDETQKRGIIAYLRAVTPKAQGSFTLPTGLLDGGLGAFRRDAATTAAPPSSAGDAGL